MDVITCPYHKLHLHAGLSNFSLVKGAQGKISRWSLWHVPGFLERWFEQAAPFRNKNDPRSIFSAETETFHENYVYAMTTDVMGPRVA